MTTFTNSEGKLLICLESVLLQLISSNNYYTSGEHDIIFTKIGSNKRKCSWKRDPEAVRPPAGAGA